jgi:feruloyl esterase
MVPETLVDMLSVVNVQTALPILFLSVDMSFSIRRLLLLSLLAVTKARAGSFSNESKRIRGRSLECSPKTFQEIQTQDGVTITVLSAQYTNGTVNSTVYGAITNVPTVCAVTVNVVNTTDTKAIPSLPSSNYTFGLFLPDKYNNKILTVGGYSFAGGINWPNMAEGAHYGFAAISTDNGHASAQADIQSWGNDRAKQLDWGYRALHGSVVLGKAMTNHYYGSNFSYSYYSGCSTGGRQGLKEIQYDATSFDGALIGAPAWDTANLNPWVGKMAKYLLDNGAQPISNTQTNATIQAVLKQCDLSDSQPPGQRDNIVSEPEKCKFDISSVQCPNPNTTGATCLSKAQVTAIKNFYMDYSIPSGLVSHGWFPGSEREWATAYFGYPTGLTGFDFDYERYMMDLGSSFSYKNFSDDTTALSQIRNPGNATANQTDIRAYRDRGGKILMYHGTADGLIPTLASDLYYTKSISSMNTTKDELRSWFRYFRVPGMNHCTYSDIYNAPWDFAGAGQASALLQLGFGQGYSVPNDKGELADPRYDALMALTEWVENKKPVDQIIASAFNPPRTRVICPDPEKPTYNTTAGNTTAAINTAANWHCS